MVTKKYILLFVIAAAAAAQPVRAMQLSESFCNRGGFSFFSPTTKDVKQIPDDKINKLLPQAFEIGFFEDFKCLTNEWVTRRLKNQIPMKEVFRLWTYLWRKPGATPPYEGAQLVDHSINMLFPTCCNTPSTGLNLKKWKNVVYDYTLKTDLLRYVIAPDFKKQFEGFSQKYPDIELDKKQCSEWFDGTFVKESLKDIVTWFNESDNVDKETILECAQMFNDDVVLKTIHAIHFTKDFKSLKRLNNLHFSYK